MLFDNKLLSFGRDVIVFVLTTFKYIYFPISQIFSTKCITELDMLTLVCYFGWAYKLHFANDTSSTKKALLTSQAD